MDFRVQWVSVNEVLQKDNLRFKAIHHQSEGKCESWGASLAAYRDFPDESESEKTGAHFLDLIVSIA